MAAQLHTLWIGPRLGWVERLCLASMTAHGHHVVLWTYGRVEDVPAGVELRSAESILPERFIVRDPIKNSVGPFADRFRYHLLRRHPGATWVDADILAMRPIDIDDSHLCGWEDERLICGAVLRLPPESAYCAIC